MTTEHINLQLGRHGLSLEAYRQILLQPSTKSRLVAKSRADLQKEIRFQDYYIIEGQAGLPKAIEIAEEKGATTLVIAVNPYSGHLIDQHSEVVPSNLMSGSRLFGLPGPEVSKELILATEARLGKEAILFGAINRWIVERYMHQLERKIRSTSTLDAAFYHVPNGSATLLNKALEMRPGRRILAFDFNSMFPSVLSEIAYPHPAELKTSSNGAWLREQCVAGKIAGVFRCRISDADDFLRRHHMFAVSYGWFQQRFVLPDTLETLLHANEVAWIAQHASVEVLDGVYSTPVSHPLAPVANKLYEYRTASQDPAMRQAIKKELVLLHAASAVTRSSTIPLSKADEIFFARYGAAPFLHNRFILHRNKIEAPDPFSRRNVYGLNRQVLASARIKLLRTMEDILQAFPQAEICYANVDSIHVSIPEAEQQALLAHVKCGAAMGQLKLEAEGVSGAWLDTGRWCIRNAAGGMVMFKSGHKKFETPRFNQLAPQGRILDYGNHAECRPFPHQEDALSAAEALVSEIPDYITTAEQLWLRITPNPDAAAA